MTSKRIKNILKKEWEVMSKDISSVLLVTLLPFLIIGQVILYIWLIQRFGSEAILASTVFQTALEKLRLAIPEVAALPATQQLQVLLVSQVNFYLQLIPTMIAMTFASFSIMEEKLSRSLEPLLATPVRTWELLLGKALSGAIPALIMTWISGGIFLVGVAGLGWGNLLTLVINPTWFMSLFLITPAITVLSFLLGIIGSSQARDPKSAQNFALVIIFPVLALIAVQVTGIVWFTPLLTLVLVSAIGLIDYFVLRIAVRLFQREAIVLKWH